MSLKTPLNYLRHRRDQNYAQKPTTHEKFASCSYINPQIHSPLFAQLPGEVRHLIYQFCLQGSPDLSRPYSIHTRYYRPGYTHARFININLLLACRRIYLEVDHLAVSLNEHLIYNPIKQGPPGHIPYLLNSPKYRRLLKRSQREHIRQVHIFAPQLWLEDWNFQFENYCKTWLHSNFGIGPNNDEHPERLKITLRHTDWWYYRLGENSPLAIDPKRKGRALPRSWIAYDAPFEDESWGSRFKLLKGLKVFELELETVQQKKEDLDHIVEQAFGWKLPLRDANTLVCDPEATVYASWTGSRHLDGLKPASRARPMQEDQQPRERRADSTSPSSAPEPLSSTSRRASTTSFIKNRMKGNSSNGLESLKSPSTKSQELEQLGCEDRLEYYVVTLTFRAQHDTKRDHDKIDGDEGQGGEGGLSEEVAATADNSVNGK